MRIFISGATSKIGRGLLDKLLQDPSVTEIYALTRNPDLLKATSRLHILHGDLVSLSLGTDLPKMDLCLHLAGLTHSFDERKYFDVNYRGTLNLARCLQQNGCQRFCFISSQTAGVGAGAYALSKFQAEKALLSMDWSQLLILRPSEIIGAGSNEGLDRFLSLAKNRKIYPWLLSKEKIMFSPLSAESFNQAVLEILKKPPVPRQILILRGAAISSTELAQELFHKYRAVPIPVYLPLLKWIGQLSSLIGRKLFPKDQIPRLLGKRQQSPAADLIVEDLEIRGVLGH